MVWVWDEEIVGFGHVVEIRIDVLGGMRTEETC